MGESHMRTPRPVLKATGLVVNPWTIEVDYTFDLDSGPCTAILIGDPVGWVVKLKEQPNVIVNGTPAKATKVWTAPIFDMPVGPLTRLGSFDEVKARYGLEDETEVAMFEFVKRDARLVQEPEE